MTDAPMSLGGSAGRGAPAAPSEPGLLSLPDDALLRVFAHCNQSELVTLFKTKIAPCHALSLAFANQRLARLCCRAVVTRMTVTVASGEVEARTQARLVQLLLRNCPRLTTLTLLLDYTGFDRAGLPAPSRLVRLEFFGGVQLRAVKMADLEFGWGSFDALLRACPRLVELEMVQCTLTEEGGEWKKPAGAELQTWSRLERLRLNNCPEILLCLVSNLALLELLVLRELHIAGCDTRDALPLQGSVFDECATLSKITKLSGLSSFTFSSSDAARLLARLPSLEELDVSHCGGITPALWGVLPPSLSVLNAKFTWLFEDAHGNGLTRRCGGPGGALRVLSADIGLETWEALSSGFGELRELDLAHAVFLGDERVEDALAAMPHLQKLDLRGCRHVGNRTAAAMAQHPMLSSIKIDDRTAIDAFGMADLERTFRWSGENWIRRR